MQINLDHKGAEEMDSLMEKLYRQIREARQTLSEMQALCLKLEARVNQPPAAPTAGSEGVTP